MTLSRSAGRLAKLTVVLCLALSMLGFAIPAASASKGHGWLRLAHLSPNTPALDVYLYSFGDPHARIVLKHVSYGMVSPYERVPAGEYTVAMRAMSATATSKPVLSATVNVASGRAYTVAGMGPVSGLQLQVLRDRLTAPRGKALVRVIQASMHQTAVTVSAAMTVLGRKLKFTAVTRYQAVKPGDLLVRAVGESEHGSERFKLAANTIYTFVIMDDSGHLKVAGLEDSAGSKVMPSGGAQMGFGGTAPRPGCWPRPEGPSGCAIAGARRCMRGDLTTPSGRHISPIRVVRRPVAAVVLACGLLAAGAGVAGLAAASQSGRPAVPLGRAKLVPVPLGRQAPAPQPFRRKVARPTRLIIPSIGVRTKLIRLGLTSSGALQPPATTAVAGWYTGSPRPGATGAAVIGGHIDSQQGPGIFFRLRVLHRGSRVYVRRANGTLAVFKVTAVRSYLKTRFPTEAVYGPAPGAQLRLITCGGTFDYGTGHYLSNVVVFATLVPRGAR